MYDLTDILSVMISCTATFVAIIGGLIASKAISNQSEQESIDSQLKQIDTEIKVYEDHIERLDKWLIESDVEDFIDDNIDELLELSNLSNIYDTNEDNRVTYDELLPYWNKAIDAVKLFEKALDDENVSMNNAGIPVSILELLDDFQKRICSNFSKKIQYGRQYFTASLNTNTYVSKCYNDTVTEKKEYINKKEILVAKEQLLQNRRNDICINKDIKGGMKIFAFVSATNIILPTFFMIFNPTSNKVWYYIETAFSLITFLIGIITMIKYIYSLFPKRKTDIEEME